MTTAQIPENKLIDGSAIARKIRADIEEEVRRRERAGLRPPCLGTVLVGNDPSSHIYVKNKRKFAKAVGIKVNHQELLEDTSEKDLLALIDQLNNDRNIDGILVQLPLPPQIDEQKAICAISPTKDIDGFHPENVGLLFFKRPRFLPCTARGVLTLIEESNTDISGAHAVVVGRSHIAGKPIGQLLLNANATLTICHSHTKDLASITSTADILIAAVGKAHILGSEHVKKGAVVIDVGINRLKNGTLVGDVNTKEVIDKVRAITPVPRGVGPMTIAMLLQNTLDAHATHFGVYEK